MAVKTVGQFTFDTETSELVGPKSFMESEDYAEWLARVKDGRDSVINFGASPDFVTALLVSVQTCYAGWHGRETFLRSLERTAR